jgi:uncharacterized protein
LLAAAGAMPGFGSDSRPVRSLLEARHQNVVIQEWDSSCGAAALATLLRFQLGDPVNERTVALGILRNSDPGRVRGRGGFSLLDLKRYAESRGFVAEGFAGLTPGQLLRIAPAIVPIRSNRGDHFVVFRGAVNGHAVLADPAFGNRTVPFSDFEASWKDRLGFVVHAGRGKNANRLLATKRDLLRVEDDASRSAMEAAPPRPLSDEQLAGAFAIDPVTGPDVLAVAAPAAPASSRPPAAASIAVSTPATSPAAGATAPSTVSPTLASALPSPLTGATTIPIAISTPTVSVPLPITVPTVTVQVPPLPPIGLPGRR